LFIASLIGGVFNYLYQLYVGRSLGPAEYGIFGSLFAISYILFILTDTIQTSAARYTSKFIGENNSNLINYLFRGLLIRMFIIGVIFFILIIITSGFILTFLKIDTIYPVIILGCIFLFSNLLPVNLGIIQGIEKFKSLGLNIIINFSTKLVFGILLISIGFGVNGALGAVVIGFCIALLASFIPIKHYLKKVYQPNPDFKFSELYHYFIPALIAMFCFAVPANVDVILARHFFESQTAGIYTAATVLGKIILIIPGAIAIVMFPKISKLFTEKKSTNHTLNISLIYTSVLAGISALGYWFFPYLAIKISYGVEYINAIPVLQLYGIAMFFFSLTVILMRYSLAIHHLKYAYIMLFFTILEIGLMVLFNNSMIQIVQILLVVNIILFITSYVYLMEIQKRINTDLLKGV
jgi:O-antigen/teichoic acid export membrane protein